MDYIGIIIVLSIGWFLTEFEPLHMVLEYIEGKLPKHPIISYLFGAFTCFQCMAFWTGIVFTGSFITACVASLLSLIVQTWLEKR